MQVPARQDVETVIKYRAMALEAYQDVVSDMRAILPKLSLARNMESQSHFGTSAMVYDSDTNEAAALKIPDPDAWFEANRRMMDLRIWTYLINKSGIKTVMDAQAIKEFKDSLMEHCPEATADAIYSTFEQKRAESGMMFNRGLANTFSKLDRRFKSHDGFKLGSRVILDRFCDEYGYLSDTQSRRETMIDMDRVFAVLNGDIPEGQKLIDQIQEERRACRTGYSEGWQSEHETRYFRVRIYKNGNAHLWFNNDDLMKKVNKLLGDLYGEVLPDGAAKEDITRSKTGTAVSKDLQFYATPVKAAKDILDRAGGFHREARDGVRLVLEPSAGEGALVQALFETYKNIRVDAVEYDAARAQKMKNNVRAQGVDARVFNMSFFDLDATPKYDMVFMNPPFYGTHYMDHVIHAFNFLKEGGRLIAILPVTAELGDSKKHKKFQEFVEANKACKWASAYRDLPAGTFSESGTNINTVYIELVK